MNCICGHDGEVHDKEGRCIDYDCQCPEYIRDGGGDGPEGLKRLLVLRGSKR